MSKNIYRVRPGVIWVNGARVPSSGKVTLTTSEAKFDLDHGRIEPVTAKPKSTERGGADTDGGN